MKAGNDAPLSCQEAVNRHPEPQSDALAMTGCIHCTQTTRARIVVVYWSECRKMHKNFAEFAAKHLSV